MAPEQKAELDRIHIEMSTLDTQQVHHFAAVGRLDKQEQPHMRADNLLIALVQCLTTPETADKVQVILDLYDGMMKWYA